MSNIPRLLLASIAACLIALAVAAPVMAQTPTATPTPTPTPAPVVVLVGAGEPGYAVNLFGPNAVTVTPGSVVAFRGNWLEPHTVTFAGTGATPNPDDPRAPVPTNPGQVVSYSGGSTLLNSGFLIRGLTPDFQVRFPSAGTFNFLCIIHPGMAGAVTVANPGSGTPSTQAQLDTAAGQTFATATTALKAEAARIAGKPVAQVRNADGTTTWRIVTVGGMAGPSDVQQFVPAGLNVQLGDTVVWENSVQTPHTVTFLGGTALGPPLVSLEDPRLRPVAAPVAGYEGTGVANSGILGVGFGPNPPFSVKFTKAGTFPYICILHVDQGMGGTITVAAQTAPIAPKTGSAGLASHSTPVAVVGMLGILAVSVLLGARGLSKRTH